LSNFPASSVTSFFLKSRILLNNFISDTFQLWYLQFNVTELWLKLKKSK
jgi:hypothetical protein